ncbi:MAG: GDSL-type esterase/lipase family protein [Dorea formicigenerans]
MRKKVRTTEVNKIVTVVLKKDDISYADEAYQWNYGQILRIQGGNLPKAVEVHFSLEETSGTSVTRIGTTTDGVTEAPIPDSLLENNNCSQGYTIYAYIYLEDGTAGRTEYEIAIPVKARTKPEVPGTPEEPELFRETVKAVNDAADRAAASEQNAKASEVEAGKYAASASESAVAAEKTKEDALKEVGEKKQKAIEAIQEQEETSVGKITTHTDDEIQRIQNQTAESKGELEQTITNADDSKGELDHSIEIAGTSKTALDKSVELAGTAKTELDTSTQKAGEAKTALDGSTKTAGEMQETLSATVKQAGTLDTSLGEKIEVGTQLNEDITASGEKAVQGIQTAGSEQLGKMQAVAEEFTADREQITTNKEDIGSLKEDLAEISKLEKAEIEFTITGYFVSNGYHVINEYFKSTDFVELVKDGIYIPLRYHLNGSNSQEIFIYNKEKRVIKTIPLSPSSNYQVLDGVLEYEKDFYYAKFCSYSVDFDYWVKFDTIRNQIAYESLKNEMIPRHEISMEKLTGMIHDPSTNFINPLDVNKGYVNNDGEFNENNTWHNTGLIRLESGEKYYWNGFYNRYYAFYDKSFSIVLKSTNPLPNPFVVPENAMYGLFSMDGDFSGCWIHNTNKKPADYAECLDVKNIYALGKKQGVENAGKVLSINDEGNIVPGKLEKEYGASTKIYKKGNLLKLDEIESGYIQADGTVHPYSTLWCTGFCEVEQGKVYVKGFLLSQYFAFYDKDKKVLKTYEEGAMQQYTSQIYCTDVPVNAKYFRCTTGEDPRVTTNKFFFVSNKPELPEEENKLSFDGIFPYNVAPSNPCDYAELTVGVFNKCVFIGDSLTYGTFNMDDGASYGSATSPQELADKFSYPSQFKKITGIDIINLGVAGETSVSWYNSHLDYNYSGCDMAIIHIGVNDAAFKVSDADTKAALINIINSLKSSVKNIKIFLCTIIPAYSNVERTGYRQKSEAIRELYNEKYEGDINVILLDIEKYGHTKAYTSYTSGHLSALGYYVLARDIARYISWHIDNNLRDYRFIQFIGNDGLYTGD